MTYLEPILAITLTTFREAIRARLLLAILCVAFTLLLVVTFFGMVTIGDQIKVLKDFGLAIMSLTTVVYAGIAGATLLDKELQKRTIFNILSKSVSRSQFIVGKCLGLWLTTVAIALVLFCLVELLAITIGDPNPFHILFGLGFVLLESFIVCACALLASSIVVTPSLAGLVTIATFFVGRSLESLLVLAERMQFTGPAKGLLIACYYIMPNFSLLNVADQITFGAHIDGSYIVTSILYAGAYGSLTLMIACICFERRNFT